MNRPRTRNATSGISLRLFWLLLVAAVLTTSSGCLIPMYSGDPIRRAQQLIYTSEDLRAITDEWERIWFLDQPSHMTPYRTHGGVL
jgi:ABC-type dipeptide/oligopeptide/nickel transport system permease component